MAILRTDTVSGTGGRNAIDGSLFFDGSGRLSVPNSADVRLGSNDFTIEAWIRAENPGDWTTVIGMWDSSATRRTYALQRKKSDSKLYFYVSADGGSTISATATQYAYGGNVTLGDWHHVAGVRDGNTIRAYLNGVEVGNASFTASILNNTTDALFIGDTEVTAGGESFNGDMSNVRMIKGTCLYPSGTTFTPPTEKLKAIDGTVLLCCQDSNDPTQEATGKTITGYGNLSAGTELLSNGNWSNSTTGWTATSGTWTASSGTVSTTGEDIGLDQTITTQIGAQYRLKYQIVTNYSNSQNGIYIRDADGSSYTDQRQNNVTGQFEFVFTARESSHRIRLYNGGTSEIRFGTISVIPNNFTTPKDFPPVGKDTGTVLEGDITFDSLNYMTLPKGTTIQSNRGRGLFMGGYTPSPSNTNLNSIDYVQIQSLGNSIDFGDLFQARYGSGGGASSTRAVNMGGRYSSTRVKTIDYTTIATTGNAIEFGELQYVNAYVQGASNNTRGLNMGGGTPNVTNLIEYLTIASTGNAQDFGFLTDARGGASAVASPTRAVCMGGYDGSGWINIIDYVEIATLGDATDFGDLYSAFGDGAGLSSNNRGIMGGG